MCNEKDRSIDMVKHDQTNEDNRNTCVLSKDQ